MEDVLLRQDMTTLAVHHVGRVISGYTRAIDKRSLIFLHRTEGKPIISEDLS